MSTDYLEKCVICVKVQYNILLPVPNSFLKDKKQMYVFYKQIN